MTTPVPNLDDRRPTLQPPRFGLGSLFIAVAVMGALSAVVHYFGGYGAAIAILFLLCVAGHVLGNALGTKLRQFGDTPLEEDGTPVRHIVAIAKPLPADFAPVSRLHGRHPLGKRIVFITGTGGVLGALIGFLAIVWFTEGPMEWRMTVLGIFACSVLGGIWTFAAASFIQVTIGVFVHAHRESPRTARDGVGSIFRTSDQPLEGSFSEKDSPPLSGRT